MDTISDLFKTLPKIKKNILVSLSRFVVNNSDMELLYVIENRDEILIEYQNMYFTKYSDINILNYYLFVIVDKIKMYDLYYKKLFNYMSVEDIISYDNILSISLNNAIIETSLYNYYKYSKYYCLLESALMMMLSE